MTSVMGYRLLTGTTNTSRPRRHGEDQADGLSVDSPERCVPSKFAATQDGAVNPPGTSSAR